ANCASFVLGWMMEGRGISGLWWRSSRKRGKWSCGEWQEKLVMVNSGRLKRGREKGIVSGIYKVGPYGFQGLTMLVLVGLKFWKDGRISP
nr:hypothetical protein [Tanacetum cinerariifolium]